MMIDMNQIHSIQLGILQEVARLSAKYHLKYFMTGGSAIGAVRHHGFIPWDDDIDIGFTRHDFEKFIQVAPTELVTSDYLVEENRLNPRYEYDFAKVMTKDSQILERGREEAKAHNGIFIDVFPFDRLPADKSQRLEQKTILQDILEEIRRRFYPDRFPSAATGHKPYTNMSLQDLYDLRLKTMVQYDHHRDLPYVNLSSPYDYAKETIFPSEMQRLIKMPFENLHVPVLAGYDSYLHRLYGDYMKLPPVEKRIQRHILNATVDSSSTIDENESDKPQLPLLGFESQAG